MLNSLRRNRLKVEFEFHSGIWFEVDWHWNGKQWWKVLYEIQTIV
jgi:hypothetical protein